VHSDKVLQKSDLLELAQIDSKDFKHLAVSKQKKHYKQKSFEYPDLSESFLKNLQSSLDNILRIKNGADSISPSKNKQSNRQNKT